MYLCLCVHVPGYGMEAIWKSAYLAHLSTFSEDDTLHVYKKQYINSGMGVLSSCTVQM